MNSITVKTTDEGYGRSQLNAILCFPWVNTKSPIRLKENLTEEILQKVPFLRMFRRFLEILSLKGEVKLTVTGNLPVKMVQELYPLCPTNELIESGISKLYSENECLEVRMAHDLGKAAGWVKHRNGKISLTAKGKKIVGNPQELLTMLLFYFCNEFDTGAYDGFEDYANYNCAAAFMWILLDKYGDEDHDAVFYAKKYYRVCPDTWGDDLDEEGWMSGKIPHIMELRLFWRFMYYFGVVSLAHERYDLIDGKYIRRPQPIRKTGLLNELVIIDEPSHEPIGEDGDLITRESSSTIHFDNEDEARAFISMLQNLPKISKDIKS